MKVSIFYVVKHYYNISHIYVLANARLYYRENNFQNKPWKNTHSYITIINNIII